MFLLLFHPDSEQLMLKMAYLPLFCGPRPSKHSVNVYKSCTHKTITLPNSVLSWY